MILPQHIRYQIAGRIIRMAAPILMVVGCIAVLTVVFFSDQQYMRIITAPTAMVLTGIAWWLAVRGRPMTGIAFLVAGFVLATLVGTILNGGMRAPIYGANLVFLALVVVIYGLRGGILYAAGMLALGAILMQMEASQLLPVSADPPLIFLLIHYGYVFALMICFVTVPVRLMLEALYDSQNRGRAMQRAVAERRRAQEELQSILDMAPDIIYRLDPKGLVTYISQAISRYGYQPKELIGTPIIDVIHPEDRDCVRRQIQERRTGARSTRGLEVRLLMGTSPSRVLDDSQMVGYATFHVFSDGIYTGGVVAEGTFVGTQGIAHDITRIQRIEERISQLASVVEQAAEGVIITNTKGVITYVNPRFELITGYARDEVIGRTPRFLKSTRHDDDFYRSVWEVVTSGEAWIGRIWNRIKNDRDILQDMTITPIFDAQGHLTGYSSVGRDITLQEKLADQLRRSQKMEAIGTLAGGIAHDFNNILAGMIGYAELARYDVAGQPDTLKKIDSIIEAGGRASDLVRQILTFSRSQAAHPKPVCPQVITKEVLKLLRASLPSTIAIETSLGSTSHVMADPTNIHQVVMNLGTNAGHAMRKSGGLLSVEISDVVLTKEGASQHMGIDAGAFLKISMRDTGNGIDPESLSKIFDPFFTTKAIGEGTGMGLAMVHSIVRDLGGAVTVKSEVGKGTVFQVLLPIIDAATKSDENRVLDSHPGGTERILFVDDEMMQAELVQEVLERHGYRISIFTDSLAALEHFEQCDADYDLVITDLTMPHMTGDVLAGRIHAIRPEIPVIMCTGFSDVLDQTSTTQMDVSALLHKPVVQSDLLYTIRAVMDEPAQAVAAN